MSSVAKIIMDGTSGITRIDSPKITQERKFSDYDPTVRLPVDVKFIAKTESSSVQRKKSSSVRSPAFLRKNGKNLGLQVDGLSPADAEAAFKARYVIENDNFAKGAYGKVEIGMDLITKTKVAIKRIPKATPIRMVQAEVKAGQLVGEHDNIATFQKYFDFGDHHALVFQFIDGADLFSWLEGAGFSPIEEEDVKRMLTQIVSALKHAHSKKIAHRDIKLENILVDKEGKAYLIDFGLCGIVEDGKLSREWCGSDNYLCPQIVRRTPYDGFQADVFSIGVVTFALLFGVFPFENLMVNSKYSNDPRNPLPRLHARFPMDVKVSREAKELVFSMLEDDPNQRITVDDILNHPWLTGVSDMELSKDSNQ